MPLVSVLWKIPPFPLDPRVGPDGVRKICIPASAENNNNATSPNGLDYNSRNVSAIYITTHNPNNFNFRYFYNQPYFIFYSRVKLTRKDVGFFNTVE
jgi:hypothetical protein